MNTPTAVLFKVTIQFDYQKEDDDTSTYTAGSLKGARQIIEEEKARPSAKILWYSIEEHEYYPCDENDPLGRQYIGIGYSEFKDFEE